MRKVQFIPAVKRQPRKKPLMGYDLSRVTERLFIGSQITSIGDVEGLSRAGVTHLIDATVEGINPLISGRFAYLHNPTEDDGVIKTDKWFAPAVDFALGALAHPGPKVLCHCNAGVNRSASLAYAIMRALGWPSFTATEWIHTARPVTLGGLRYARDADMALTALGWLR